MWKDREINKVKDLLTLPVAQATGTFPTKVVLASLDADDSFAYLANFLAFVPAPAPAAAVIIALLAEYLPPRFLDVKSCVSCINSASLSESSSLSSLSLSLSAPNSFASNADRSISPVRGISVDMSSSLSWSLVVSVTASRRRFLLLLVLSFEVLPCSIARAPAPVPGTSSIEAPSIALRLFFPFFSVFFPPAVVTADFGVNVEGPPRAVALSFAIFAAFIISSGGVIFLFEDLDDDAYYHVDNAYVQRM
jgi:hypothetical protein